MMIRQLKRLLRLVRRDRGVAAPCSPPEQVPRFMRDDPAYAELDVGRYTYGSPTILEWGEGTALRIGSFCSIAKDVVFILGGNHRVDWVTTYPFASSPHKDWGYGSRIAGEDHTSKGDIVVGSDVWIGRDAMIMSGVEIGCGAVVAARAVVPGRSLHTQW